MSEVCHSAQKDNPSGLTPEDISNDEPSSKSTMKDESNSSSITKNEFNLDKKLIESENSQDYEKFITYDENGTAFYTNPSSNQQYVFDKEKNQWITKIASGVGSTATNVYENEYYRWCVQSQRWILKNVENDFYKWNTEKNEWEPKTHCSNTPSVMKDGQNDGDYFWNEEKKAWFPKIDDDFIAIYQTNYGFVDNTSEKSTDKPVLTTELATNTNKSQAENNENNKASSTKGRGKANQPQWFDESPENCTKVYVSNLPEEITEEEFVEVMSKCGMILRDTKTKKIKVKLYAEPSGQLKGDGLVHYIRSESVQLAIDLLDGYDLRGKKIKVQRAQFQMRGEYNPKLKPKRNKKDKEKEKKFKEKALDWRPDKLRGERGKHERVVVIKNLFTPDVFENHVDLIIDYQNNVQQEASKYGTVKKVVIYSSEAEGVAEIVMNDPEEADFAVKMMNGTTFETRILSAETWDGKTRYRKNETETEKRERLSKWDEFLEADDIKEPQ